MNSAFKNLYRQIIKSEHENPFDKLGLKTSSSEIVNPGLIPTSIKFTIAGNDDDFHNLEENYDEIEITDFRTKEDENTTQQNFS